MKNALTSLLAIALLAGFATVAEAQSALTGPPKVSGSGAAAMLTDAKGMTLYIYDKDAPGKSNCSGGCAAAWPPLTAAATDKPNGKWTIVTREDGSLQWAYDGKPVYGWRSDKAPGDVTGDGVGGTWHTARPAAAAPAAPAAQRTSNGPGGGSAY